MIGEVFERYKEIGHLLDCFNDAADIGFDCEAGTGGGGLRLARSNRL